MSRVHDRLHTNHLYMYGSKVWLNQATKSTVNRSRGNGLQHLPLKTDMTTSESSLKVFFYSLLFVVMNKKTDKNNNFLYKLNLYFRRPQGLKTLTSVFQGHFSFSMFFKS